MGQGAVLGLSNSFMSLGRIIGPLWAGYVFDLSFDYPYMSGAVILFLGFLISMRWKNGA
jgi:DHA1 family multidrug resistance protein-like MFS transporter